MIKDIGIEGLAVTTVDPKSHIYDAFNNGGVAFVLPEGCEMEMIDVTGIDGVERYVEGFSGKAMLNHIHTTMVLTGNQGTM